MPEEPIPATALPFSFAPTRDDIAAERRLDRLLCRPDPARFQSAIRRLHDRFVTYAATCPAPLPAPGLVVTPEIRRQSELYLPICEISSAFNRLYRSALTYAPVLESTPFHGALSWADLFNELPSRIQFTANPARLLEALLEDRELLMEFLFDSFLPRRFYGEPVRYPGQEAFIREWPATQVTKPLRCLDAACGDGAGSYGLARLLLEQGWQPGEFAIEGWTIEPLEVWTAAHASFPHDARRQAIFRGWAAPVFEQQAEAFMVFRQADLRELPECSERFDLIICNGLLGGPIINRRTEMRMVVRNLAALLRPGGLMLAADRFHGGWKKQSPKERLGNLFKGCGLAVKTAGEGIAGLNHR